MEGAGDDDERPPAVGRLLQPPAQGRRHDGLPGVGPVGVEDLPLGVQTGQGRPGQGVGEEVRPGADVGGAAVLEELLPDIVVVAAAQAPGEGVQGGGAGQVVLGLQGAGGGPAGTVVERAAVRAGSPVDEGGLGVVLAGPAQGDPLGRELGQRVVGGGAVDQREHSDRGDGVRVLEGGQQGGVLGGSLDEDDGGADLLQQRAQGQSAGRRVVTYGNQVDAGARPGALGAQGAAQAGRDVVVPGARGRAARPRGRNRGGGPGRTGPHSHSPWAAARKSFQCAEARARSRTTESM